MRVRLSKKHMLQKVLFGVMYFTFIVSEQVTLGNPLYRLSVIMEDVKLKYLLVVFITSFLGLSCIKYRCTNKFKFETKNIIYMVMILLGVTVYKQINNGFLETSYNEIFFFIAPLLFVYVLVNVTKDEIDSFIDIAFFIQCVVFLFDIANKISISNILSIRFLDSYSPFESEHSFYAVVFFFYFISKKDKLKSIISFIVCFLAFKRLAIIACISFYIFSKVYGEKLYKKECKDYISYCITIVFIIIPVFFDFILTDYFQTFFWNITGIDLDTFVTGRLYRFQLCVNNEMLYGLGSSTELLKYAYGNEMSRNLHNDILRIYLECGLVGSISFSYFNFKIAKHSLASTVLMVYLFSDMLMNHFIGAGRCAFWILIYLVIFCYNTSVGSYSNANKEGVENSWEK